MSQNLTETTQSNSNLAGAVTKRPPPRKAPSFPSGCERTTTGLKIKRKLTLKQWLRLFAACDVSEKGHQWWIGDALLAGEQLFPEDWAQVLDPNEEAKRENEGPSWTHKKYMQVASRIPDWRRRQSLKFGHHDAVAFLKTEEEQEGWMDLAEEGGWSVDKLRRKIRKAKEGNAEGDPALDIQVLQDPLIRQWLDGYRAMITDQDDTLQLLVEKHEIKGAKFLHRMTLAHIEQAMRQLDRTLAIDCGNVKRAVGLMLSGTIDDVERCMRVRGFFMSRADLKDRLQLLIDLGEATKEKAEDQRCADARGDVVYEYKRIRKPGETEADDDDDVKGW